MCEVFGQRRPVSFCAQLQMCGQAIQRLQGRILAMVGRSDGANQCLIASLSVRLVSNLLSGIHVHYTTRKTLQIEFTITVGNFYLLRTALAQKS